MSNSNHYDIVILVSNDLVHDRRMHRTCRALTEHGMKVIMVGRELPGSLPLDEYNYEQYRLRCHFHQGPLFYGELIWRMSKRLKSMTYSKLLCVDFDTLGVLKLISSKGKKVYFDAHELFTEVPELEGSNWKKWVWERLAKSSLRHVNKSYTVSQEIANILGVSYGISADVVHNVPLLESDRALPEIPMEGSLKLVYLGVLNPGRGLEQAIAVVRKHNHLQLSIVGDGPMKLQLEVMTQGCERIIFHGKLSSDDFQKVLISSHIGLNLLDVSSKSYYFSLANKFFDYAHAGLPVITMDTPTYRRLVDSYLCGYLINELSTTSLDKLILEIELDRKILLIYQQGALRLSRDYNWQKESKELIKILAD